MEPIVIEDGHDKDWLFCGPYCGSDDLIVTCREWETEASTILTPDNARKLRDYLNAWLEMVQP